MEQRQFSLFLLLSLMITLLWFNFAVPVLFPGMVRPPNPAVVNHPNEEPLFDAPADALFPANMQPVAEAPAANANGAKRPTHPELSVLLGAPDPDKEKMPGRDEKLDEFFLAAGLTTRGAAIDYVELTDKKQFPAFGHRADRVRVLGSDPMTLYRTFALTSPEIDKQLDGTSLDKVNWEVVLEPSPETADRAATFRIVSPDGRWEITKRYELKELSHEDLSRPDYKKTLLEGYEVKLKITVRNLTNEPGQLSYVLQGPVGVPLEDPENSYKYRDIRMGFLREDGTAVDESKMSAAEAVKKSNNGKIDDWTRKIKYIGVDVLYFTALVLPKPDEVQSTRAMVVNENSNKPEFSDVSVELKSPELTIPANGEITHEYSMYAGPKRKELIGQIPAMAVMDYGWFDSICRGMVWLLNMFHGLGLSYGIAIICLTVLVRTLLMPISKHQAANAAKMKELQPKMVQKQKELEAKYGKNTDEYMRAASELSKEQLGLMMSGCLPVFLQLPIFIALYRAIGSSIELRMEPFLWFENLASPDALFQFPFALKIPLPLIYPWPGWTHFNLLPCISTALMFMHQKLTMPPATNDEQAQQQRIMNFMMIFMGAMFYRVPSGLCLYFIATNVWSMTERWVFEHFKKKKAARAADAEAAFVDPVPAPASPKTDPEKPSALKDFWGRLQQAADKQVTVKRKLDNPNSNRDDKKRKKR